MNTAIKKQLNHMETETLLTMLDGDIAWECNGREEIVEAIIKNNFKFQEYGYVIFIGNGYKKYQNKQCQVIDMKINNSGNNSYYIVFKDSVGFWTDERYLVEG